MVVEKFRQMLSNKSVIREISVAAVARGKEIGYDNMFDYSLGNPSVPVPDRFNEVVKQLLDTMDPLTLHGYSESHGIAEVRDKVAESLEKRFGLPYKRDNIFMTSGAAGAMAHAVRAVCNIGSEVLTFAPYFPEYNHYINETGAVLKVVPADTTSFQINFEEFEKMLNPKTEAVLINTPNNPSGIVYSTETIKKMSDILTKKSEEFGHEIYIISDEPYREIVFTGVDAPVVSQFYDNTIICYSFSKSLSLPGERIGYVAVSPNCKDAETIIHMCTQISRGIGHNCPSSLIQLAVAEMLYDTADLSVYETNMNLLYDELTRLGFEVVKPGGTFYIFPKALEEDANEFCKKALKYDLALVPGDSFGCPGFFRIAYCVKTDKVERSLEAFRKLAKEYGRQ
ncbi:MAG: pyridoxal phosphate-dependent aminotransferase [Lachnospiraceae bacterium]|jgi:aspartate aminotransferase|nr:pyridoxal phosphate-dependent aminotransferase [Lachnospiraceae bacterium]